MRLNDYKRQILRTLELGRDWMNLDQISSAGKFKNKHPRLDSMVLLFKLNYIEKREVEGAEMFPRARFEYRFKADLSRKK